MMLWAVRGDELGLYSIIVQAIPAILVDVMKPMDGNPKPVSELCDHDHMPRFKWGLLYFIRSGP
jgi:hypothetical protein